MYNTSPTSYFSADINGDGVGDLVRIVNGQIKDGTNRVLTLVYITPSSVTPSGEIIYMPELRYELPGSVNWTISNILGGASAVDYDGDGINDLLFPYYVANGISNSKSLKVMIIPGCNIKNNDTTFYFSYISLSSNVTENPFFTTIDVDGDGKDEIIYIEKQPNSSTYHGGIVYNDIHNISDVSFEVAEQPREIFTGDYNNDGLRDIIVLTSNGYKIFYNNGFSNSYQTVFSNSNTKTGNNLKDHDIVKQGDFDGDGLIDFYCYNKGENIISVAVNHGDGTFNIISSDDFTQTSDDYTYTFPNTDIAFCVHDLNHDGKSDVILSIVQRNSLHIPEFNTLWFTSNGTDLQYSNIYNNKKQEDIKDYNIFSGDFDGDGFMEFANYGTRLNSTSSDVSEYTIHMYNTGNTISSKKIKKITDGLGMQHEIGYSNIVNPAIYSSGESIYPIINFTMPLPVVSRLSYSDIHGNTETNSQIYKYENLRAHVAGGGVLGFATTKSIDENTGIEITNTITQIDTVRLIPINTITTTKIGNKNTSTNEICTFSNMGVNNWAISTSKTTSKDIYGVRTVFQKIYDVEKGVLCKEGTYMDEGDTYEETTYNNFQERCGTYLPTTVTTESQHIDGRGTARLYKRYEYDNKGQVIYTIENSGTSQELTTHNIYDGYGNIIEKQISGYGLDSLTIHYMYDNSGRFLSRKYTSPASDDMTYTYDVWGNLISESNITNPANTLMTTYTYDGWGRKSSVSTPDGNSVTYGISSDNTNNEYSYFTTETPSSAPSLRINYDARGREIFRSSTGLNNILLTKRTNYNDRGLVNRVEKNSGALLNIETFTYDDFGRVIKDSLNNGISYSYTYENRATTRTRNDGNSIRIEVDANGNIKKAYDIISSVNYTYGPFNKPTSITDRKSTINIEYDALGRRSTFSDPDAGTQTYTYAADGRLLSETNGRGIETAFTYNAFGRVTEKDCDGLIQTNIYGTEGYGKNRIIRKEHEGLNIDYTYDALGRITSETRSIESNNNSASTSYTISYEYNNIGKLFKKYYPGGLTITYQYDSLGYNTGIIANGISIYNLLSFNGKETVSSFCNSITTKSVNNNAGYPQYDRVQFGSDILEEMGYTYDERNANLLSRYRSHGNQNSIDGSDENIEAPGDEDVSMPLRSMNRMDIGDDEGLIEDDGLDENDGMVVTSETFRYDRFDRLTQIFNSQNDTTVISYSSNGNIKFKSGLGNYYYNANSKPHAVSSIDNTDGIIGNATHQYSYHPNGKIEHIHDDASGRTMSFMYGPDDEKWETVLEDSTDIQRTVFYFDNYEKVCENNSTREYYFLENNVIAIKENGQFSFYKAFVDNLGNILSVYTSTGSLVFEAEYDAWGKQTVSINNIGLRYGYTGHEMLPEFDIINMEGRLYDPVIGRFLSCDNYVQEPDNPQNFNRYSYCLNNPLKYTDPSGEVFGFIGGFFRGLGDFFSGDILAPITETFKGLNNDLKLLGGWFIGDFGQVISRFTLELPQSIIGYLYSDISQVFRDIDGIYYYDGATFVIDKHSYGAGKGVSLGSFINIETNEDIPKDSEGRFAPYLSNLYMHEYGHYLQSQEYSWGYLFSVGIPSGLNLLWGDGKEDSSIRGVKKHNLKWYEMKADTKAHEYFSGKN